MTSDAKIGLLLGLVFIFVIAFIINGLPNFGNRSQAEAAPMTNFPDENLGVADSAQSAQEQLDWEGLLAQGSEEQTEFQPVEAEVEPSVALPATTVATDTENGAVRSVHTLDSLMGGVSRTIEDVIKGIGEASQSVTLQAETSEPAPAIEMPGRQPIAQPVQTARSQRPTPAEKPARKPGKKSASRVYVVQDGDVLATVAKKAYGPEEGNKLANIKRIYQANSMILNSPDEIVVGQKLVIPPLPKGKVGAADPAAVLAGPHFEKVGTASRKALADVKQGKPKGWYYVVQDGDNLWKIAVTQLNSGSRSEEIAKLNSDILKSKDALTIGMRLRLPAK